ncbi:MAG: efflux RND transporter periplasmic adaptor subunit [Bacteroidota bacterium]
MKRIIIIAIVFLAACASCAPSPQEKRVDIKPVRVMARPVEYLEYKIPVRATGLLGTTTEMKLSFKTGGIIQEIHAREGSSVSRGEILATLDLSEIKAQVNQARIGLEKAQRDMERAGNLYRDSVVTLEQYQNARSAFELARSQKLVADFNLLHSRIKAPSDGTVQKLLVEANEVIGPGYPAILFASTENDWVVRAALTDKDIVMLSMGDSACISMDAFPDMPFPGEVTELATVADPVTGTYEAEVLIHSAHPQFRTGFISRVQIWPKLVNRSLVVPIEALLEASDHSAVLFIYQEGRAKKRRITTGTILGGQVVVLEGLDEGDLVITEGAKYLRADEKVELLGGAEGSQTEGSRP